jgi:predicted CXXCH cytochrome family protein
MNGRPIGMLTALLLTLFTVLPLRAAESDTGKGCQLCVSEPGIAGTCEVPRPVYHLTLPDKDNPHGKKQACADCHSAGVEPAGANFRPESCTDCHQAKAHAAEIHSTHFAADSKDAPVFEGAVLGADGKSTCITCHGIACKSDRSNRAMLRGGPWPRETDFCFSCHKREDYRAFNPHQTASEKQACLSCHAIDENGQAVTDLTQLSQPDLCMKCHKDVSHEREHLGKSIFDNRLKRSSADALDRFVMHNGTGLPLGENGTISCSTCHDTGPACTSAGSAKRTMNHKLLRAPKEQICYACHDL